MTTTVRELLQHFKDDPKLRPLFTQLDELTKRVEVANAQNVMDPRTRPQPASRPGQSGVSRRSSSLLSPRQSARVRRPTSGPSSDSATKIEEASLPIPPEEPWVQLPSPPGGHDWEALQGPVNHACAQFSSPAAKATWKQWALTPDNVAVVVAVAWWTVAQVFQPDHPMAPAVKEHAFTFFARRYALDVLSYGGAGKDLYFALWQSVVSAAAVEVLRSAFPRSAHKLDDQLEEFVRGQLVRWTAGVLPADLHPSDHELVGRGPPAAHTHYQRHKQAATALASTTPGTARAHLVTSKGHDARIWAGDGNRVNVASVVSGAKAGPTAMLLSPGQRVPDSADHVPMDAAHTSHQYSHALDPRPTGSTCLLLPLPQGLAAPQPSLLPDSWASDSASNRSTGDSDLFMHPQQRRKPPPVVSPFAIYEDSAAGANVAHCDELAHGAPDQAPILPTPCQHPAANTPANEEPAPHQSRQTGSELQSPLRASGFVVQQASPVMAHMFEVHDLGPPRKQQATHPGVMAHTFGTGQRSRRRPLDGAALVQPPEEQAAAQAQAEFSYAALARQSTQRAADAVAKYEACKAGTRRDVAALRRHWLASRDAMQAQAADLSTGTAAKDMSDKLSFWLENDVDRMLRDQPVATIHVLRPSSAKAPAKQKTACMRPAAAHQSGKTVTASEAVLQAGGGASVGATISGTGGAADRNGRPPNYLSMTAATVAGAGCASASFLAATAATSGNSGPSLTRIMQPWSKMRSLETQIRSTLSQARHGSNDMAAKLAVVAKEKQALDQMPGMPGNGKRGSEWKPAPIDYSRGTLNTRLFKRVQEVMRGVDMDQYV